MPGLFPAKEIRVKNISDALYAPGFYPYAKIQRYLAFSIRNEAHIKNPSAEKMVWSDISQSAVFSKLSAMIAIE